MARAVATVGYVGLLRPAPGTWGSLAALPLGWVAMQAGPVTFALLIAVAFGLGLWATGAATDAANPDPGEVVIDELVGQWIALLPLAYGAARAGVPVHALWPGWIAAFLLFRLFDIWKPGPVGWADRRHGPLGVMLDDVAAGVLAALGVLALAALAHGVVR
ncbi:phosphatidylglycerophosphatase A [Jannaschia sp. Os4]|uniref:phosphatidylglycerophosphatase A n=1 Tax=Jannaschia sp. Os4 TaxID=2807617 RepID=UPI0019392FBB|nr:phosphatidylglycerophosphatase A [Jannaschia sp. Os4]